MPHRHRLARPSAGIFNILPLYIVLITLVPVYLWLAGFDRRLMPATSAVIYAGAWLFAWDLPSWPIPGGWFFNPDMAAHDSDRHRRGDRARQGGTIARSTACTIGAAAVVLLGLLVATDGFGGTLGVRGRVRGWLDLGGPSLGLVRPRPVPGPGLPRRGRWGAAPAPGVGPVQPPLGAGAPQPLVFLLMSRFAAALAWSLVDPRAHDGLVSTCRSSAAASSCWCTRRAWRWPAACSSSRSSDRRSTGA